MSVLLTATKNVWKRSEEKRKKRTRNTRSRLDNVLESTPPPSDETTTVWYWSLDGVPTTLMYNHNEHEVWCNGRILQTMPTSYPDPLSSRDQREAVEFSISVESENASDHKGCIIRLPVSDVKTAATDKSPVYCLYVDGASIVEHSLDGARRVGPQPTRDDVMFGEHAQAPPSYEEATAHIPVYTGIDGGDAIYSGVIKIRSKVHEKMD